MEFYRNAIELRLAITDLLLRDFGIKDRVWDVSFKTDNMEDVDREAYNELLKKYGKVHSCHEYPAWYISTMRTELMNLLNRLITHITKANSIYATSEQEYHSRRAYQNEAISDCEVLLQEFQYVIAVIPVDLNKLMKYVDMIDREIALLKGWRKRDNSILTRLKAGKKSAAEPESKPDTDKTE